MYVLHLKEPIEKKFMYTCVLYNAWWFVIMDDHANHHGLHAINICRWRTRQSGDLSPMHQVIEKWTYFSRIEKIEQLSQQVKHIQIIWFIIFMPFLGMENMMSGVDQANEPYWWSTMSLNQCGKFPNLASHIPFSTYIWISLYKQL